MPTDQIVTSHDVLRSMLRVRREGSQAMLKELEHQEPDLCEVLLEEVTSIHHLLANTRLHPGHVRRLQRRVEKLALVLVLSLRQGYRRLLDTPLDPPASSSSSDRSTDEGDAEATPSPA